MDKEIVFIQKAIDLVRSKRVCKIYDESTLRSQITRLTDAYSYGSNGSIYKNINGGFYKVIKFDCNEEENDAIKENKYDIMINKSSKLCKIKNYVYWEIDDLGISIHDLLNLYNEDNSSYLPDNSKFLICKKVIPLIEKIFYTYHLNHGDIYSKNILVNIKDSDIVLNVIDFGMTFADNEKSEFIFESPWKKTYKGFHKTKYDNMSILSYYRPNDIYATWCLIFEILYNIEIYEHLVDYLVKIKTLPLKDKELLQFNSKIVELVNRL